METAWSGLSPAVHYLWLASIFFLLVMVALEEYGLDRAIAAYVRRRLEGP